MNAASPAGHTQITSEVRTRLTELFALPERRIADLEALQAPDRPGVFHGRIPGIRLWYWGDVTEHGAVITRVWPDDPYTQAA